MTDETAAVDIIMSAVKERSVADSEFRNALINNPRETLEAAGIDLSDCDAINVIDGEPNHLNIVLPPSAGSVSEGDLDEVVGGARSMQVGGYSRMLPKLRIDAGKFGRYDWGSRGKKVDTRNLTNHLGDLAV